MRNTTSRLDAAINRLDAHGGLMFRRVRTLAREAIVDASDITNDYQQCRIDEPTAEAKLAEVQARLDAVCSGYEPMPVGVEVRFGRKESR